ncbi:uncharacterized protein LOC121853761 [Homarus americanus]|nr:uncharacterized protein LOC121853761 [Homarus americanus]
MALCCPSLPCPSVSPEAMRKQRAHLLELMLMMAALLLPKAAPQAVEEEEVSVDNEVNLVMTTITSGVNHISTILEEREESCAKKLSEPVEESLAEIEHIVEVQWERLTEAEGQMKVVDDKMSVLLRHRGTLQPTSTSEGCAEPFEEAGGGCFWPHKNPGLSWERARKRCQQAGGDLATPEDLTAVRNYLRHKLGSDWWYLWLGGRITGPRRWAWLDSPEGEEREASEDDWANTDQSGDCVALNGGRGYRVMKWDCQDKNWYLCEKKI